MTLAFTLPYLAIAIALLVWAIVLVVESLHDSD